MRVGLTLAAAGLVLVGVSLDRPAGVCSVPRDSAIANFGLGSSTATVSRIVQSPSANTEALERRDASGGWEEVPARFVVPLPNEGILTDTPVTRMVADSELPPGTYRWRNGSTFVLSPDAPPRPSPLGAEPTITIQRPSASTTSRGGGCGGSSEVCDVPLETVVTITLGEIPPQERPYVANYVVRMTDLATGRREIRIGSGLYDSPDQRTLRFRAAGDLLLCVEVAGLGWDGALGEVTELDCS